MDCGDCSWIAVGLTNCICKLRNFCSLIVEIAVGLRRLQLDCGHCSWIADIAVGLWRLQLDCGDCSWIAEIAVGLRRLQLDCGDCSHRHAVGLTNCICKLRNFCNLSNQTAISAIQLQSPQSNCNLRNPTAISTIKLKKFLNLHIQLVNPTASR